MTWRDSAACPDADSDVFFPVGERGTNLGNGRREPDYRAALAICARCPVQAPCLDTALLMERTAGGRHGVWGGTTPQQRAQMVVRR